jgi:Zn-dependent protease/CBS domain-containing protein
MPGPFLIARILGIRVTVAPSWILIFVLMAASLSAGYLPQQLPGAPPVTRWLLGGILAAALFASVLAHEFSHALVARARRVKVDEVMLFVFGGVAKMRSEPRDASSEFLIAAAGPMLSIVLGVTILLARGALDGIAPAPVLAGLWWLGAINIVLAVFNLVPGFPLDGGRILRAILWWRMGDFERATIAAARVGQVIAGLLIALGITMTVVTGNMSSLWQALIGWFLWSAATQSIRIARLRDAVEGLVVRELMTRRVPAIRADQDVRVGVAQTSGIDVLTQVAVIEKDGRLVGVASVEALTRAAASEPGTPARDVAEPADEAQIMTPDDPAELVVARLAGLGGKLPLVVEDGRLVGTIDPRALVAALREAEEPDAESQAPGAGSPGPGAEGGA